MCTPYSAVVQSWPWYACRLQSIWPVWRAACTHFSFNNFDSILLLLFSSALLRWVILLLSHCYAFGCWCRIECRWSNEAIILLYLLASSWVRYCHGNTNQWNRWHFVLKSLVCTIIIIKLSIFIPVSQNCCRLGLCNWPVNFRTPLPVSHIDVHIQPFELIDSSFIFNLQSTVATCVFFSTFESHE